MLARTRRLKVRPTIGTMIEVPRAALTADAIAEYADFFSFGTNDLTQMTYALSRDDAGQVPARPTSSSASSTSDPFVSIDEDGIGELMRIGVEQGRARRPDLKLGICGEHGGDPEERRLLRHAGLRLRLVLALPRAGRAARGGPGGRAGRRDAAAARGAADERRGDVRSRRRSSRVALAGALAGCAFWRGSDARCRRTRASASRVVDGPAVVEFHRRASTFYGRLAQRRFNVIATFRDQVLRDYFRTDHAFSDYYADFAQDLDDAHFERNVPGRARRARVPLRGPGRRPGAGARSRARTACPSG